MKAGNTLCYFKTNAKKNSTFSGQKIFEICYSQDGAKKRLALFYAIYVAPYRKVWTGGTSGTQAEKNANKTLAPWPQSPLSFGWHPLNSTKHMSNFTKSGQNFWSIHMYKCTPAVSSRSRSSSNSERSNPSGNTHPYSPSELDLLIALGNPPWLLRYIQISPVRFQTSSLVTRELSGNMLYIFWAPVTIGCAS